MFGDKRITYKNDDIIIDGKRYNGIVGLVWVNFHEISQRKICTDDDIQTYRSILLTTNAHRRVHSPSNQVMGSKIYKYKNIIAALVVIKKLEINKRVDLLHTIPNDKMDISIGMIPTKLWIVCSRQASHNSYDERFCRLSRPSLRNT